MPSSTPMASTCSMPACESKWVRIAITAPPPSRSSMVMTMTVIAFPSFGRPSSSTSASRSSRWRGGSAAMTSHVLSWRSPSVPVMKKVTRPPARRSWSTTVAG